MQSPRADVLGPIVDDGREIRNSLNRIVGKPDFDPFGIHQGHILFDQSAARLGQYPDELVPAQRLELDTNRETPLKLRNEIRWLRHVKSTGCDEEDVIRSHHPILGVDSSTFDNRQNVALDAFAADVRAMASF